MLNLPGKVICVDRSKGNPGDGQIRARPRRNTITVRYIAYAQFDEFACAQACCRDKDCTSKPANGR
jgi:hypothetical protein